MSKGHLSIEEIEQLSQQKEPAENQSHVENCRQCHTLLEKYRTVSAKLDQLASVRIGAKNGMNCPDERVWFDVAAGTLASDESLRHVQHATECESCAQRLRAATRMFQEELSNEEEKEIAALPSASARQQKKLAQKMAGDIGSDVSRAREISAKRKRSFWWPLSFSLAGAAAVAAVVFFAWPRNSPADVEKLLANAYASDRKIEMRVPYAKHAEIRQQRGAESESYLNLPESFRRATDIIAAALQKDPTDPRWLLLEARLDLLRRNYGDALAALSKIPISNATSEQRVTYGTALLEKGEAESDRDSYLRAVEEFSAALSQTPRDPVALFNRALAYDKLNLPQNAIGDWKAVLDSETDSGWRAEATQYLASDIQKVEKDHQLNKLLNPEQINVATISLLNSYIEQLQEALTASWLVDAARNPKDKFGIAALKLATVLEQQHSDPWLGDVLKRSTPSGIEGLVALAAAIRANAGGHYAEALKSASAAATILRRTGNEPGEFRARFEEVYAVHRSIQGSACLSRARPLMASLSFTSYGWLQAQVAMEKAVCENYTGALETARRDLARSRRIAEQCHFPVLLLRNLGLSAGIDRQQGQFTDAWNEIDTGLDLYWRGDYPRIRLYQLYMVLGLYAEQRLWWNSAEALERAAVNAIEDDLDAIQRGTARLQLVNVLVAEKKDTLAAAEMARADEILASVRTDPLTSTYRLTSKIELAELQLARDDPSLALETLKLADDLLNHTQGYFIFLNYHRVRGDIYLRLGQLEEASHDYLSAVVRSEGFLQPLTDQRQRLRWFKEVGGSYRGLVLVALRRGDPNTALRVWEWYRTRSLPDRSMSSSPILPRFAVTLAERDAIVPRMQTALPSQPHVVYATFPDGVQIWILGPNGTYSEWIPVGQQAIRELVDRFARECAVPSSSVEHIRAQGRHLYDLLWRPVIPGLAGSDTVVLETDDSLANLPFEAIDTPEGKYLGERYSILYSPGYFIEGSLREPKAINRGSSAVLVEGSESDGQVPIAGEEQERSSILASFPNALVVDASKQPWGKVEQQLARAEVAHFVAHGEPAGSGTALVFSGRLHRLARAQDFSQKYLGRLQLMVLAGCETRLGRENDLLDIGNLVHTFLAAGIPNIIGSRWNVDSTSTAELMQKFYEQLQQVQKPSIALFEARRQLAAANDHPYFWAGFVLIGRAQ